MKQMENRSKEYYSRRKVADGYDAERFTTTGGKMFDTFEKNVVISNLPKNREGVKVLDAGAGSGRFTVEIVKRGFDVVSSDYSPAMLDVIKSKVKDIGFENNEEVIFSNTKKKIYCVLIQYPELSDSEIGTKVGVSRHTVSRLRRGFENNNLIRKINLPNLKKLGFEILTFFHIRFAV